MANGRSAQRHLRFRTVAPSAIVSALSAAAAGADARPNKRCVGAEQQSTVVTRVANGRFSHLLFIAAAVLRVDACCCSYGAANAWTTLPLRVE